MAKPGPKAKTSLNPPSTTAREPLPLDPIALLEAIAGDDNTAPSVAVAALRSLMEARGQIGKHQRAPGDALESAPLLAMSRADLESELRRLRALIHV